VHDAPAEYLTNSESPVTDHQSRITDLESTP
jgi:hypothetical protein